MKIYKIAQSDVLRELQNLGAEIHGNNVILYRGGDVSESILKKLRYNDYLSTVKYGTDAAGNEGASGYGKNIVRFVLPISDIKITNGEVQYIGNSQSIKGGKKYPREIYKAYNDAYGSNYTAEEIDSQDNVRQVASQALSNGSEEFDLLMKIFRSKIQSKLWKFIK